LYLGTSTTINGQIACIAGIWGGGRESKKVGGWSDYSGRNLTGCLRLLKLQMNIKTNSSISLHDKKKGSTDTIFTSRGINSDQGLRINFYIVFGANVYL